jgi:hypothetical protein
MSKEDSAQDKRTLYDCLMRGGVEGVLFRFNPHKGGWDYRYTIRSFGKRQGISMWIDGPDRVETDSQELRVVLADHLYDSVVE